MSPAASDATPQPDVSVTAAFAGATVLLTGATGYVGSLVLEQLLRLCPGVERILILVRPKRGRCPAERRRQLLDGGLFHQLWRQPALLNKVEVLEGDLRQPGCGLSKADLHRAQGATAVIHAAASVTFTAHVFESLADNYHATAELARVAATCSALRVFTYVSTAFVSGFLQPSTCVTERFYPAFCEGENIRHEAFVRRVESMSTSEAEAFVGRLAFPNTYCLTKWLSEQLVAERHSARFPVVILRPAIIGAVAGAPYPGYVGNRTGATGAALAIATGIWLFSRHAARSIFDLVPGDAVSSAILLAAAATMQSPVRLEQPCVVHVGTSTSGSPLFTGSFYQMVRGYFSVHPAWHTFNWRGQVPRKVFILESPPVAALMEAFGDMKFGLIACLLWLTGRRALAGKVHDAWKSFKLFNHKRLDFDLRFDMAALRLLAARLPAAERATVRPLWEPGGTDGWERYMHTYMAGASVLCLRQLPQDPAAVSGLCAFEFVPPRAATNGRS